MKNPLRLVDRRTLMIILGGTVLVTLISVIAIVLTTSDRNRRILMTEQDGIERQQQKLIGNTGFGMEDFYLDVRNPHHGVTYPARSGQSTWMEDDVMAHWIDPAEAGIESLSTDNDARILESLGGAGVYR